MAVSSRHRLLIASLSCALLLVGCAQSRPTRESSTPQSLGSPQSAASEIASRAAAGDTGYFGALGAADRDIPSLIAQVSASGIATNWAEHLRSESATRAVLDYPVGSVDSMSTFFSVELSRGPGGWRAEQIYLIY